MLALIAAEQNFLRMRIWVNHPDAPRKLIQD